MGNPLKSPFIVGLLGLAVFLGIIELAVAQGWIIPTIVPRPSALFMAFRDVNAEMDVVGNFLVTLGMTAAATSLALLVGIPFGYFLYRNTKFGVAYEGWLAAAFAAPTVLLYPLFLVIFGRTHLTLILMGFIPGAIPIIIQTRQGLLGVSRTLLNVGRSFNVSNRRTYHQRVGGNFWATSVK